MNIQKVHLPYKIPGLGSEFETGRNCARIEVTQYGWIITGAKLELDPMATYAWALLCTSHGWARMVDDGGARCAQCNQQFKTNQALSSHIRNSHPEPNGKHK